MYTSGADNASYVTPDCEKAGGVRRDSPLGPVCCAKGGCAPQEADLDAIGAMAHKHVTEVVSPDMAGNCVLDWESWQPVVVPDLGYFGYCPGGLSETLPRSDGDWRPRPTPQPFIEGYTLFSNYSVGLVRQRQPHLSEAEALEAAAHEFLSAATAAYVKVLEVAKAARPNCHWGYWGQNALCSWHRRCTNQTATSGDPKCGFQVSRKAFFVSAESVCHGSGHNPKRCDHRTPRTARPSGTTRSSSSRSSQPRRLSTRRSTLRAR